MIFQSRFPLAVILAIGLLNASQCLARGTKTHKPATGENAIDFEFTEEDLAFNELDDYESDDIHVRPYDAEDGDSSRSSCGPSARNTDEYIDRVLNEARPKFPDPAFLPDRIGRFRLFNGTLFNLTGLQRSGPAMVRCTESTFSFLVPVGLQNLTGKYFWETDGGVPVFRGFIDMFIRNVEANVLYTRRRNPDDESNPKARVDEFKITKLEGVNVNFDGLGPLNKFVSGLSNLVIRFFSRGVSRVIEGPLKNAINKELENVEKYERYYF